MKSLLNCNKSRKKSYFTVGTRPHCFLTKIAKILHKMAAPWPCDCFIQKQKNDRASGSNNLRSKEWLQGFNVIGGSRT